MNAQGKLDRKPGSQCIGCHLSLDEGKRYVSTSAKFLATVLVLETYHLSPNDYNGNPLGVDDEGKQKYSKVLCEGDKCEYCKKGYKKTWGRKVRWEIPMTYLQTLREFVRTKRKHCANCGSRPDPDTGEGGLATIGLTCPNCEYQLEVQDPTVAEEIARSKARCPQCGSMVKYTELLLCSNCDEPRRPSIFDMDLWLMRTGQKPQYKLIISDYKIGPISKKALDEIHEAEKPLPLADIAEPMPLTAQCTLHEVPNPFVDNSNMVGEY
jgi:ribosomal protein S27AE